MQIPFSGNLQNKQMSNDVVVDKMIRIKRWVQNYVL